MRNLAERGMLRMSGAGRSGVVQGSAVMSGIVLTGEAGKANRACMA